MPFATYFPFGNNPGTGYNLDLSLDKAFPGVILDAYQQGTEPLGAYCVQREVNGDLYSVVNAEWNGTSWQQINSATPSSALQLTNTGLSLLTAPANSPTPIVWTVTAFTGGGIQLFTPQQYGAVGDGHNDDTSAIQQMFDAIALNGGGIAFFNVGNYKTTYPVTIAN